jgi:hypothetical protein
MIVDPTKRFYIRYGIQRWDDGKWFLGSFVLLLVVLIAFDYSRGLPVVTFVVVLVMEVIFLAALFILRWTSYLQLTPDRLRIRYLLTRIDLPYTAVARVRKQPLEVAFQPADRRRYRNRFVRRLAREPAVYVRIDRRESELLARLERRLGRRVVTGADIVLPITDVEEFVTAMKSRLRGAP